MAEVKKILTVTFMLHNEETLIAKDTADGVKNGANALAEFKAGKIAKVVTETETKYVPFHAVIWVKVEAEEVEVETPKDANCNYEGC